MTTPKQSLSNKKSEWKKAVDNYCRKIERLLIKVRAGEIITMGEVYRLAYKVQWLGNKAVPLAEEIAALDMREHVLTEVQESAHELESYSRKLYGVAEKKNLPTEYFPLFESMLEYNVLVEDDPLTELERIMGGEDGKEEVH